MTKIEEHRVAREEAAKGKKGHNIVLLQEVARENLTPVMEDTECFRVIAGEPECIRSTADVHQFMHDNEVIGALYGIRFTRYAKDGTRKPYVRTKAVQFKCS